MITKITFFSAVLAIAMIPPISGQYMQDTQIKPEMKQQDVSNMMGKPTVDATVEGLHMKVWLTTQEQGKAMLKVKPDNMKGMNDSSMAMDNDMQGMKREGMEADSKMTGTHHMVLGLTGDSLGKGIANASAKVLIVSPSKKSSTVDLKPAKGFFGGDLTLDEKGEYEIT
ncbi:MAG: hypothetical protein WB699_05200, partial [Bacteroidota bacterium]